MTALGPASSLGVAPSCVLLTPLVHTLARDAFQGSCLNWQCHSLSVALAEGGTQWLHCKNGLGAIAKPPHLGLIHLQNRILHFGVTDLWDDLFSSHLLFFFPLF